MESSILLPFLALFYVVFFSYLYALVSVAGLDCLTHRRGKTLLCAASTLRFDFPNLPKRGDQSRAPARVSVGLRKPQRSWEQSEADATVSFIDHETSDSDSCGAASRC